MVIELVATTFIVGLLSLLYFAPSYFRRLAKFLELLKSNHPELFERLGRPSTSPLDATTSSMSSLVATIVFRRYVEEGDEELTAAGDAARFRLLASLVISALIFVSIVTGNLVT